MTLRTLTRGASQLKLKQIRAVFESITVNDEITNYLSPKTRFTTPSQIFEAFQFLNRETKEYFITLHLDGKNRIICLDTVSHTTTRSIQYYFKTPIIN